ncbi:hypothetical protein DRQ18_00285 [bacterium]|nr:MAG: hypothetical protein DRQ18_00285 [bacterium]
MKFKACIFVLFAFLNLYALDHPIIFLHGNKEGATSTVGWQTWYPDTSSDASGKLAYPTAMTKIIDSQYGGYIAGDPLNCSIDSTPRPMWEKFTYSIG